MFRKIMIALVAAATMTTAFAPQAEAFGLGSRARGFGKPTLFAENAPLQYKLFCLNNPSECRKSRRSVVAYTPKIRALMTRVNAQVNRQIKPRNERVDVWSIAPAYGDCDDYAMTKRHQLIRAGFPSSALKVAVVRTRSGEGHAVLIVKTSAGEFALDNLRRSIVRKNQTGYRYLQMT